jgi:hypothetical protein
VYRIDVRHAAPDEGTHLTVDGVALEGLVVPLRDDGRVHAVELVIAHAAVPPLPSRDPALPGATA